MFRHLQLPKRLLLFFLFRFLSNMEIGVWCFLPAEGILRWWGKNSVCCLCERPTLLGSRWT